MKDFINAVLQLGNPILEKYWWGRLLEVFFFIGLVLTFVFSSILGWGIIGGFIGSFIYLFFVMLLKAAIIFVAFPGVYKEENQ